LYNATWSFSGTNPAASSRTPEFRPWLRVFDRLLIFMQPLHPTSPQLTEANVRELAAAKLLLRRVNRAVSTARFDGWTIAIFAGLSLLCGFSSPSGILLSIALGAIAYIELRAANALKRLDPLSVQTLGINQLALCGILILYFLWCIYAESTGHGIATEVVQAEPQLAQQEAMVKQMSELAYLVLIAVSAVAQGSMALYYFSRRKHVEAILRETPKWIIDTLKAGFSL
jgi:hypothetical protein